MKAYICKNYTSSGIGVLIPKKRGYGFIKYPCGGDHANNKYRDMLDLLSDNGIKCDVIDCDGYAVNFDFRGYLTPQDRANLVPIIKKAVLKLWPYLTDIIDNDRTQFFDKLKF